MPKTEEQCREIRQETKNKILKQSILFFARNGFAGTKIGDLAKYIGIGQGTMYSYFKSKEDLFQEIYRMIQYEQELKELKLLQKMPISAKKKIYLLSKSIISNLEESELYAAKIALNTQVSFEENHYIAEKTTYQTDLYKYTEKIIEQGQKEGTFIGESPKKLVDYYWGVVYLYSLKKLFTSEFEMITVYDLERIVLYDKELKR